VKATAARIAGALLAIGFSAHSTTVLAASTTASRPAVGRHAAQLCVTTTANAAPSCGPAQVDIGQRSDIRVRVDDVVYHLQLHNSQLDVVLMHGSIEIDDFTATYQWSDKALRFDDDERNAHYEIRFDEAKRVKR
jgi:hypothetical protein